VIAMSGRRQAIAVAAAIGVAVSLAPSGASGAAKTLRGKTSQGTRVSLGPAGAGGRKFTYQARLRCSDGTTFTDNPFWDLVRIRRGRFRVRFLSDRGATKTIVSGTVRGKRASGRLLINERYSATANAQGFTPLDPHGTVLCSSGSIRWSAR